MKKAAIIIAIAGLVGWAAQSAAEEAAPFQAKAPQQEVAPTQATTPVQTAAPVQTTAPSQATAPVQATAPTQATDPILEETLEAPSEPVPRQMRISERFGRSVSNIFFSPLELPAQIYVRAQYQEDRTDNPFAVIGGLVEGVPMGLVYFPWRLYAGLVDLFTLWAPECDKALIYPEYVSFSPDFIDKTNLPVDKNPKVAKKNSSAPIAPSTTKSEK